MAKKVSKNARVAQRAANVGTGRDFVKVVKPVKNPETGHYTFKEMFIHKEEVESFFSANK